MHFWHFEVKKKGQDQKYMYISTNKERDARGNCIRVEIRVDFSDPLPPS